MRPLLALALLAALAAPAAAQLAGTYTVGGASPDYATISDAVADLTTSGVAGPTTFQIQPGTYAEQVTIPAIAGATATNDVTFVAQQPGSVEIRPATTPATNWVIRLDGAAHVTLYGLTLGVAAPGNRGRLLVLASGAHDLTIEQCLFDGDGADADDARSSLLYRDGTEAFDDVAIIDNTFRRGWRGVDFPPGQGDVVSAGVVVRGNWFDSVRETALSLRGVGDPIIEDNLFTDDIDIGATFAGIVVSAPRVPGAGVGRIVGNELQLDGYNALFVDPLGISLLRASGLPGEPFLVANNLVGRVGGSGIEMAGVEGDHVAVLHNTVRAQHEALAIEGGVDGVTVFGNLLYSTSTNVEALRVEAGAGVTADYNVYAPDEGRSVGVRWDGVDYATVAEYQAATRQDAAATQVPAPFEEIYVDLRLAPASHGDVRLAGTPHAEVTDDVDGTPRSPLYPYRGAHEAAAFPVAEFAVAPAALGVTLAPGEAAELSLAVAHTDGPDPFDIAVATALTDPDGLAGGPDGGGYTFADSDEPDGPTYGWTPLSADATVVFLGPMDDGSAEVALPFDFPFYGQTYSSMWVSVNGFVAFAPIEGPAYGNTALPDSAAPTLIVAALWDDLKNNTSDSSILFEVLDDGRAVVQWTDLQWWPGAPGESLTFQVLLSPDGTIEVQYFFLFGDALDEVTVGIARDADVGLQVAFEEPYLRSRMATRYTPPETWVTPRPAAATVEPGTTETVALTVYASVSAPAGARVHDVEITTTAPWLARIVVPLTVTVEEGTPPEPTTSIVIDGGRGVRYLGPPADGVTVDDLAAQNLVRGVPGYYETYPVPTLWTEYDTEAGTWLPTHGAGHVLPLAQAFRWEMLDRVLGDPAISASVELPFTLSTDLPANTRQVRVTLVTAGNRFNHLANPFGVPLDLADIRDWQGGLGIGPNSPVWTWDDATFAWEDDETVIGPWEAFRFKAKGPRANGNDRTLTIVPPGALARTAPPAREVSDPARGAPRLAFSLTGQAADGRPLRDGALTVAFVPGARPAFDADEDAEKLQPPATAYVAVGARTPGAFAGFDVRPFAPAEIPLAVEAVGAAADLTLSWDASTLPAGLPVTLVDLASGEEIDVRTVSAHAFRQPSRPALVAIPARDLSDGTLATDRFVLRIGAALAQADAVEALTLAPPAPNPSRGGAAVRVGLPEAGPARLAVVDMRGREVAVLLDGPLGAGWHEARLPEGLAAGVYALRLAAGGGVVTRRAVVVR
ncbi:T9SS type A sorting domain-containing protein [Rubrivirga sp. IMCC45206]|uniref:T9SS type A sorting domain-containing protein n=1 Tax=Rubrivirga sp. IMCC45206 TaxID=3391614 RepID=UPI00398FCD9B